MDPHCAFPETEASASLLPDFPTDPLLEVSGLSAFSGPSWLPAAF